jgi:membrane associated rhomboid family serine protease
VTQDTSPGSAITDNHASGPVIFGLPLVIVALVVVIAAIELMLHASDSSWIGTLRWRSLAYQYGAFWPGLLGNWQPNFAGQPMTMFATYAFLHADLSHMLGNVITLIVLGQIVCARVGQRAFLLIYTAAAIGGALGFALLIRSPQPMVGASGALFGLAGAWIWWLWCDRARTRYGNLHVLTIVVGLITLNVVIWISLSGLLAWQTHLGGFLAGAAIASMLPANSLKL